MAMTVQDPVIAAKTQFRLRSLKRLWIYCENSALMRYLAKL